MSKKLKREGVSLCSFVAIMANLVVCSMRFERGTTRDERTALITVFVIGAVAIMTTAIMYFGSENDRLWLIAASLFGVAFAAMLIIPVVFVTAAVTILSGTLVLFVMVAGAIALLGAALFVLGNT